jgi:hypothetical protein
MNNQELVFNVIFLVVAIILIAYAAMILFYGEIVSYFISFFIKNIEGKIDRNIRALAAFMVDSDIPEETVPDTFDIPMKITSVENVWITPQMELFHNPKSITEHVDRTKTHILNSLKTCEDIENIVGPIFWKYKIKANNYLEELQDLQRQNNEIDRRLVHALN